MNSAINKSVIFLSLWSLMLFIVVVGESNGTKAGDSLFYANCAKCHGKKGEGFLQLYPPVSGSPFLDNTIEKLPCIIRYGMKGKIERNGKIYNGIMPGNRRLSDNEIDILSTYIIQRWGDKETNLATLDWLKKCKNYNTPVQIR